MGLILLPAAKREYRAAIVWYEEDYPGRGRRFAEAVDDELARLGTERPHTFPRWRRTTFRCLVVRRFPYQIIFREERDATVVYAVAHDKQRPGYWRARASKS